MAALCLAACWLTLWTAADAAELTGEIRDAESGKLLPARLYIRAGIGQSFFARSAAEEGSAVKYERIKGERSVEMHTALSAHAFVADLPPGKYVLTAERGKEYLPEEQSIEIGDKPIRVTLTLRRWVNMAARGWYSGETHVHRTLADLPTAMLADDLNVALPLTQWVTKADLLPEQSDKNQPPVEPKLIEVSPQHVIWPLNTEYEIVTVGGQQHTLGAVFALNQRRPLSMGIPPVGPVAAEVHAQGGLLELDKHNWPWSMMLVPVMKVDLFELANNHHWRTEFFYKNFAEPIPDYMGIKSGPDGMDEKSWTEFGFQNYYALLNSGFRLLPTAGSASGVHPVPLGWSRVYVHCPDGFSYGAWMEGLKSGRSFVTNGPLLVVWVNGEWPERSYEQTDEVVRYEILADMYTTAAKRRIEVLQEGKLITDSGSTVGAGKPLIDRPAKTLTIRVDVRSSTWFVVRCYESLPDGRERFAHSAPIFIDVPGKPLRPKKAEVEYLISRVKSQIERSGSVLSRPAMDEYHEALAAYEELLKTAQ